jgi:hypothetical protein
MGISMTDLKDFGDLEYWLSAAFEAGSVGDKELLQKIIDRVKNPVVVECTKEDPWNLYFYTEAKSSELPIKLYTHPTRVPRINYLGYPEGEKCAICGLFGYFEL